MRARSIAIACLPPSTMNRPPGYASRCRRPYSRASSLLPTPGGPCSTTTASCVRSANAASSMSNSSSRPTNGRLRARWYVASETRCGQRLGQTNRRDRSLRRGSLANSRDRKGSGVLALRGKYTRVNRPDLMWLVLIADREHHDLPVLDRTVERFVRACSATIETRVQRQSPMHLMVEHTFFSGSSWQARSRHRRWPKRPGLSGVCSEGTIKLRCSLK